MPTTATKDLTMYTTDRDLILHFFLRAMHLEQRSLYLVSSPGLGLPPHPGSFPHIDAGTLLSADDILRVAARTRPSGGDLLSDVDYRKVGQHIMTTRVPVNLDAFSATTGAGSDSGIYDLTLAPSMLGATLALLNSEPLYFGLLVLRNLTAEVFFWQWCGKPTVKWVKDSRNGPLTLNFKIRPEFHFNFEVDAEMRNDATL